MASVFQQAGSRLARVSQPLLDGEPLQSEQGRKSLSETQVCLWYVSTVAGCAGCASRGWKEALSMCLNAWDTDKVRSRWSGVLPDEIDCGVNTTPTPAIRRVVETFSAKHWTGFSETEVKSMEPLLEDALTAVNSYLWFADAKRTARRVVGMLKSHEHPDWVQLHRIISDFQAASVMGGNPPDAPGDPNTHAGLAARAYNSEHARNSQALKERVVDHMESILGQTARSLEAGEAYYSEIATALCDTWTALKPVKDRCSASRKTQQLVDHWRLLKTTARLSESDIDLSGEKLKELIGWSKHHLWTIAHANPIEPDEILPNSLRETIAAGLDARASQASQNAATCTALDYLEDTITALIRGRSEEDAGMQLENCAHTLHAVLQRTWELLTPSGSQ